MQSSDNRPRDDVDRPLVEAAAAGDQAAFGQLVQRHQARLYNLARALVGDPAEAEDLTQESFVRAWRAIGRFRGDAAFGTWLYRVALNVIRSHLSRRGKRAGVWGWWQRQTSPDAAPSIDDRPDPRDLESDVARRDAIDRALATLPPDMRLVVTLRDLEGLEYRDIARLLQLPIGTVESRLFRARRRLRPLLEPLVVGPVVTAGRRGGEEG